MKVLISGYYGYGNLGDEALLSGILTGLKNDGHAVTVLSGNPEETKRLHGVNAVHRYRGLPLALLQHDALISGGGGLLQDKTSSRSLQYYLGVISAAKRLGKKVIVYGQSIGPLSDKGKEVLTKTLKGVAVAVRHEASQKLLAELGASSQLVADGALLLEGKGKGKGVLFVPRAGYPEITRAMTELTQILNRHGFNVAGLSIQADEDRNELEAIRAEVPALEVLEPTSPTELVQMVGQYEYVVSGRLHGLILAAVAGVDFCGLVYDPKVGAFLSEAGAAAFTLPVDQDKLTQTVIEKRAVDWDKVAVLKARAAAGVKWLHEQLS
jgi:polysaccharide pyruvyl transferase CsaB